MIRNIWAVGRNYADHAKELGNAPPPAPFLFLKAGSSAVHGEVFHLPTWTEEVHHEIELALRFNENLEAAEVGLALDLTERKKQNELKAKGLPWTLAKSFTDSCPVSEFVPFQALADLQDLEIGLEINGEKRQCGRTSQMIFGLQTLIDFTRQHFPVSAGDLLLTGTPAGVGPLQRGDRLEAHLGQLVKHRWLVK